MTFSEWVSQNCPKYIDKLNACYDSLVNCAAEVDIDYALSSLSMGKNKGSAIATLSRESRGRCIVHLNTKRYDGHEFPHVVFLNMRNRYQDRLTNKSIPAVVDTVSILFDAYKEQKSISIARPTELVPARVAPDLSVLVNQMRSWMAKLDLYSETKFSGYFERSGIATESILSDELLRGSIRVGYSQRYGRYVALPLRYISHNTFMGFQRIYDDGSKIMIKDFNPLGLCGYVATDSESLTPEGVKLLITHEGWANALISHFMCKALGLKGVVNVAGLFADNLPTIYESIKRDFDNTKVVINFYDNDDKGRIIADTCQNILPRAINLCFSRNDIKEVIRDYSYEYAFKEFKSKLKKALTGTGLA